MWPTLGAHALVHCTIYRLAISMITWECRPLDGKSSGLMLGPQLAFGFRKIMAMGNIQFSHSKLNGRAKLRHGLIDSNGNAGGTVLTFCVLVQKQ